MPQCDAVWFFDRQSVQNLDIREKLEYHFFSVIDMTYIVDLANGHTKKRTSTFREWTTSWIPIGSRLNLETWSVAFSSQEWWAARQNTVGKICVGQRTLRSPKTSWWLLASRNSSKICLVTRWAVHVRRAMMLWRSTDPFSKACRIRRWSAISMSRSACRVLFRKKPGARTRQCHAKDSSWSSKGCGVSLR